MKNVNNGVLAPYLYTNKGAGAYVFTWANFETLIDEISGNAWKDMSGFILSVIALPFDLDTIFGGNDTYGLTGIGGTAWTGNPVYFKNMTGYKGAYLIAQYTFTNYANGTSLSFLDSDAYTKINIYLPYIGFKAINANEVMGNTLKIYYAFDFIRGTVKVIFEVTDSNSVSYVIDTVNAVIGISFEITADNNARVKLNHFKDFATGVGDMVVSSAMPFKKGFSSVTSRTSSIDSFSSMADNLGTVATAKNITTSGNDVSICGHATTPYMIIERPKIINNNYVDLLGKPSGKNVALSQLTGFTQVQSIHLENINATDSELQLIESQLKSGVIL